LKLSLFVLSALEFFAELFVVKVIFLLALDIAVFNHIAGSATYNSYFLADWTDTEEFPDFVVCAELIRHKTLNVAHVRISSKCQ
jgi:hypothetical protein